MQTLEIAKELERIGVKEEKAYSIAETINSHGELATKSDLLELKAVLKEDATKLENKTDVQFAKVEKSMTELKSDIKWLKLAMISINIPILMILLADVLKDFFKF